MEVGKKLVVQYSLVRDPRSETNGSTSAYSDAYGAPMVKDEVKVKARVEVSEFMYLSCICLVSAFHKLCLQYCSFCLLYFSN